MTLAKGITSSYLPLAATVVKKEIADHFSTEGDILKHVLTFGGHPVPAAAALKNIEIIERENLVGNAAENGAYFMGQLDRLKVDHPTVGDVRGIGMLMAVELVSDRNTKARFPKGLKIAARLNRIFKKYGLILRVRNEVINIGPPLCITQDEVDEIVHAIDLSLMDLETELGVAKVT